MLPSRSKTFRFPFALLALLALAPALGGCIGGLALGAGAATGVAAAEERGAKNAANDKGIQIAISDALLRADLTLFHKLGTMVYEGRVLLTGVLQTEEQKDQALKLVWSASNRINEVIDEVQVAPSGTILDFSNDAWITGQLRVKLAGDREIVDINYSIETVNATVYLLGLAQNEAEIVRVTDHARTIKGVRRVVSHVWLKTDPRRRPI